MEMDTMRIMVLVGYVLFLVGFGFYQGRKVKSGEDYMIAGRGAPGWVAALSERATAESSWALLGMPGIAYMGGFSGIWPAVGSVIGILVCWIFLVKRIRSEAEKYDAVTFVDYLSKRFGTMGTMIRVIGGVTIVFFFFFYVGAQFIGGGKTILSMFGIELWLGMVLTAIFILPYTIYGGFQSVIYTDCVQSLMMISALCLTPIIGIHFIANAPDVFAHGIHEAMVKAANPRYTSLFGGFTGFRAFIFVVSEASWMFAFLGGLPQLNVRFMAIKSDKEAKIGRNVGVLWTIFGYAGAITIGLLGIAIFGPEGLSDPELVMPSVLMKLFHPVIATLFITAAIAAMLSTADSLLVLSATEFTENILLPFMKKRGKVNSDRLLGISRYATAAVGLIALGVAFVVPTKLINTIVGFAWAGVGSTFASVTLLTLFWPRFSSRGVVAAMVTGVIFTIVWATSPFDSYLSARAATFFISLFAGTVGTLLTSPDPGQEKTEMAAENA